MGPAISNFELWPHTQSPNLRKWAERDTKAMVDGLSQMDEHYMALSEPDKIAHLIDTMKNGDVV